MPNYVVSIPASVIVSVDADDMQGVTPEAVEEALIEQWGDARYVTLKNGTHFDSDEFTIIDWD